MKPFVASFNRDVVHNYQTTVVHERKLKIKIRISNTLYNVLFKASSLIVQDELTTKSVFFRFSEQYRLIYTHVSLYLEGLTCFLHAHHVT